MNFTNTILFILNFSLFTRIYCVYRQEAYKFFDKFTLVDLFATYNKQIDKRTCSLSDGPNCFQVSNFRDLEDNEYLNSIIEKLKVEKSEISVQTIYKKLNKELTKFKDKHKRSLNEVFKFKPKIVMNLLLNFESYDQSTKDQDIYMPEEKVIHFNVGYLKLNFKGKLRLTQDRDNKNTNTEGKSSMETPMNTYGVIEERDLYINFDKPVYSSHIYVRVHKSDQVFDEKSKENHIVGYNKKKEVFKIMLSSNSSTWNIVKFKHVPIDSLKIPKGYDIDNLSIQHDSGLSDSESDEDKSNKHLASLLQSVIDELIDQAQGVNDDDEDD